MIYEKTMSLDDYYKEKIRIKKNQCIVEIFEKYREILYGRKKIVPTLETKKYDEIILITIAKEIDKLLNEII